MFYKNKVFKFKVDEDERVIACKTITQCDKVHEGLVQIRTKDCVVYTISMQDNDIPLLISHYNDYIWEKDDGVKSITYPVYSVVSRLDI